MAKILFVMTGADHWTLADGSKHPTGYWAEEFLTPYRTFTAAGHEVVVATPGGVQPTADAASLSAGALGGEENAAEAAAAIAAAEPLRRPIALTDVDLADYAAVFYPGGHGPMEDLAVDADSGRLLTAVIDAGLPLGVVCHGPAALLAAVRPDGTPTFAGYRLTGFSNAEERLAGLADRAPWLLEDRLVALGADYAAGEPWAPHTVTDRTLRTGQNPASSGPLAEELLNAIG
ncbi:type 1 glutamine amidotransferase domain-containing protein [Kitasatospora sp. DSM 101779]|uniref:type 1 glutamine amidotransferase domain-containing protein n=1 Tax=Kitasatospora sp. DSM 101779 TaxID=2853165 RepID=UPI0021D83268|nr:type 1 glutamine amidotransferase domain-containing protein [Kitasatospora sp. DSM 101779]MCU7824974.1 type 1 glutamine amidotransferase domain-containing protein [Kitasatospora sp. DSM 101779]